MPLEITRLLDEAKKVTGSDGKTATELFVTAQRVSDWRKGRQPVPAADVAILADIAGLEAEAWLARAEVASYNGPKAERLRKALKKSLAAIGAVLLSIGCIGHADKALATSYDVYYVNKQIA
jgi:hypothetical protein